MAITAKQFSEAVAIRLNRDLGGLDEAISGREINMILDAVADEACAQLKKRDNKNVNGVASVPVRGIGRLRLRRTKARKARMGRNPHTGEAVQVAAKPAGRRLSVTVSRDLKRATGVLKA